MVEIITLEIEPAELMTTDVTSTTLVSAWDGVMTVPILLEALLDEAIEVVVDVVLGDGELVGEVEIVGEVELVVDSVRVG